MRVLAAVVTALALGAFLVGIRGGARWSLLAKAAASLGFVGVAILGNASGSAYGGLVLAGLFLGLIGDVALEIHGQAWFMAGLGAFFLGHVAYSIAFGLTGPSTNPLLIAAGAMLVIGVAVIRWLNPHLPGELKVPVRAYVAVIGVMTALAVGVLAVRPLATVGAVAFTLSDLAVARQRFVRPAYINQLLGLPLYYLGQILIAWSI
jgi:uncharacterized membrane protein YhhN